MVAAGAACLAACAGEVVRDFPGELIEHAGHASNVDRPNVFNARVREFLARLTAMACFSSWANDSRAGLPVLRAPGVAFYGIQRKGAGMFRFRLTIMTAVVLTGAGLAVTPAMSAAGAAGQVTPPPGGWASSISFTNQVA